MPALPCRILCRSWRKAVLLPGTAAIEIEIGGAVLRADAGVDLAFLGKIVRLLKAT